MVLSELGNYLSSLGTVGTKAVDLFEGPMPDDGNADICTQIMEYGGLQPEVAFGTTGIYREAPRLQVTVRGNPLDITSGRARAELVKKEIGRIPAPAVYDGVQWYVVQVLQPVFWLRRDEKGRDYHTFNVQIYKDPSA